MTLEVIGMFLVSAQVKTFSSLLSSFVLLMASCSSVTASRTLGFSPRYLTIQVRTLAVVSRAAKMTPMMLSAICSSVRPSLSPMKDASRSLWSSFICLRVTRILAKIRASSFLAFMDLWNRVPGRLMGIELYPFSRM